MKEKLVLLTLNMEHIVLKHKHEYSYHLFYIHVAIEQHCFYQNLYHQVLLNYNLHRQHILDNAIFLGVLVEGQRNKYDT